MLMYSSLYSVQYYSYGCNECRHGLGVRRWYRLQSLLMDQISVIFPWASCNSIGSTIEMNENRLCSLCIDIYVYVCVCLCVCMYVTCRMHCFSYHIAIWGNCEFSKKLNMLHIRVRTKIIASTPYRIELSFLLVSTV